MTTVLVLSTVRFCKNAPARSTHVSVAVTMLVVGVRKMRMAVLQRCVLMAVRMPLRPGLAWRLRIVMRMVMQVMCIVRVGMFMIQRCVGMRVAMLLCQVQPNAQRHEHRRSGQRPADGFGQQQHRHHRAHERCH